MSTITFSHQESTEPSEMPHEIFDRVNRTLAKCAEHFQPGFRNDLLGREIRLPARNRFHLQQADGQHA